MRSSRNPKVLNYVIRNALDPIFSLLEKLIAKEKSSIQYVKEVASIADAQNDSVNDDMAAYIDKEVLLEEAVVEAKENITGMIRRNLLNPNVVSEVGEEPAPSVETSLITDKMINAMGYGFIKDGASVLLASVSNYGLAIGTDTNIEGEFVFVNPNKNASFPSFMINDILRLSTRFAFAGTNFGLVEYDIVTGSYIVRTTSNGLNANSVKRVAPLKTTDSTDINGYIAGTNKGASFSFNGSRWIDIDKSFKHIVTCFHISQKLDEIYSFVFIGTNKGIYYFDANDFINEGGGAIIPLEGVMKTLPSNYINGIAYNSNNDAIYIATDSGITVVNDIMALISQNNIANTPPSYETFNANKGISSTLCFDIAIMPNEKIVAATANGLTVTSDFKTFSYITKKIESGPPGLESYMCNRIVRKNAAHVSVLHPIGLTDGVII